MGGHIQVFERKIKSIALWMLSSSCKEHKHTHDETRTDKHGTNTIKNYGHTKRVCPSKEGQ